MTRRSFTVQRGDWIRTSTTSRQWTCSGHCAGCAKLTAGPVYLSISTGQVLCQPCWSAQEIADMAPEADSDRV
jgi:hypothetical protein